MKKKIIENDEGIFEWIDCGDGQGFYSKIEDPEMVKARVPISCKGCNGGIDYWSSKFWYRHGLCADCCICYIENAGFPEGYFKSNDDKVIYVQQKIKEKAIYLKEKRAEEEGIK